MKYRECLDCKWGKAEIAVRFFIIGVFTMSLIFVMAVEKQLIVYPTKCERLSAPFGDTLVLICKKETK